MRQRSTPRPHTVGIATYHRFHRFNMPHSNHQFFVCSTAIRFHTHKYKSIYVCYKLSAHTHTRTSSLLCWRYDKQRKPNDIISFRRDATESGNFLRVLATLTTKDNRDARVYIQIHTYNILWYLPTKYIFSGSRAYFQFHFNFQLA